MNVEKMFTSIDTHVAGEAFRIIIHSPMQLNTWDQTALEQHYIQEKALLLNEPRGHRGMNGCIVIPSSKAEYAVLFMNHENEDRFSYSGLIATLTALLETGNLTKKDNGTYRVETKRGVYTLYANCVNQVVEKVRVESDFCRLLESKEDFHLLEVDQARKYLLYSLPASIPALEMEHLSVIMKWGERTVKNQTNKDFNGIILMESIAASDIRSVTFERDGMILRSPGIDSTFAACTLLLDKDETIGKVTNHSIFGSQLTAAVLKESKYRYSLETQAFVTGEHQFIYDQEDPLENGFLLN